MQNITTPSNLIADRDSANQFSELMRVRKTDFVMPDSNTDITSTGGLVRFSLTDQNGFYNFRDSTLSFTTKITKASKYDFSRIIDSIIVKNGSKVLVNLHDAWAIEQVMRNFRGTESEDLSSTVSGIEPKGNARLYNCGLDADVADEDIATTASRIIEIPLSRFTEFFMNEKYQNYGITQIEIRLSELKLASRSGNTAPGDLSDIRFSTVIYRMDSQVSNAFRSQLASAPMTQNMKHYIVRSYGITNNDGDCRATISDSPQVRSLDRIHGFVTNGSGRTTTGITELNSLNIAINGQTIKESGINSVRELCNMTRESGNITSNQFSGMTDVFTALWERNYTNMFSLQVGLEPDDKVMGGISTIGQQKVTGDFHATTNEGALLWIVTECTGTLVTYPNSVEWLS